MSYNGWKNYETWVTVLWYDNTEGGYNEIRALAEEVKEEYAPDGDEITDDTIDLGTILEDKRKMRYELGDRLKNHVTSELEDALDNGNLGASLIADLVSSAMSEVDWNEWADNLLEE